MKDGLNSLVNHNQCAFIQGRQIHDNIIIAQELLKGYNRNSGPKRCSLKIDIAKAYDNITWEFLINVLIMFCFHDKWLTRLSLALQQLLSPSVLMVKSMVILKCQWELTRGRAKVAWKTICQPKHQGGLGLKELDVWNETLLTKHLWNIATKKESLRVKWVNIVKLRGKSVWEIDIDKNDSWFWKNLIGLRDKVRPHIIHKISNGQETSVWYDRGPLCNFISRRNIYEANMLSQMKVAELVNNREWLWPSDWVDKFPELKHIPTPC
ncbi:RNA-directed DNA polymerase, eukaryota, reverse transcriptase zinc-binding domain protein [Tanacetum coccineum]